MTPATPLRVLIGKGALALACFVPVVCEPAGAANVDAELTEAIREAQRLASEWRITKLEFNRLSVGMLQAGYRGPVQVGQTFAQAAASISDDKRRRTLLRFALLHEAWHVKQSELMPESRFGEVWYRPALECQSDLMASRAIMLDAFRTANATKDFEAAAAVQESLLAMPGTVAAMQTASPAVHGHLGTRERTMAVFFGIWRATAEFVGSMDAPSPALKRHYERTVRLAGDPKSTDSIEWSRQSCERIVRLTDVPQGQVTESLGKFGDLAGTSEGRPTVTYSSTVTNGSRRPIRYSRLAMSGFHPRGQATDFTKYVFLDADLVDVEVQPGASAELSWTVRFPAVSPEKFEVFTWTLPFDRNSPMAIVFSGPPAPRANCAAGWTNIGTSRDERIATMLARLGAAAPERFAPVRGPAPFAGALFSPPNFPVVEGTEVGVSSGPNASAYVQLYSGASRDAAEAIFQQASSSMKALCASVKELLKEGRYDDGDPYFRVDRITANARAVLRQSQDSTSPPRFAVTWTVYEQTSD